MLERWCGCLYILHLVGTWAWTLRQASRTTKCIIWKKPTSMPCASRDFPSFVKTKTPKKMSLERKKTAVVTRKRQSPRRLQMSLRDMCTTKQLFFLCRKVFVSGSSGNLVTAVFAKAAKTLRQLENCLFFKINRICSGNEKRIPRFSTANG